MPESNVVGGEPPLSSWRDTSVRRTGKSSARRATRRADSDGDEPRGSVVTTNDRATRRRGRAARSRCSPRRSARRGVCGQERLSRPLVASSRVWARHVVAPRRPDSAGLRVASGAPPLLDCLARSGLSRRSNDSKSSRCWFDGTRLGPPSERRRSAWQRGKETYVRYSGRHVVIQDDFAPRGPLVRAPPRGLPGARSRATSPRKGRCIDGR